MNEQELTLVVESVELGTLTTNALKIKELISSKLEDYDAKNYSPENIDKAKEDKALLNKTAKALNDERIKLEKQFMQPFEEFKTVVKETTDMIKEASTKIDVIVKDVENEEKENKKIEIQKIFESNVLELEPVLKLENIFDDRWLNKGFKLAEVEDTIKSKLNQIRNDLLSIEELHSKYEIELKNDYLTHFDLGAVIRKNSELNQKEEMLSNQNTREIIEKEKQEAMNKYASTKVEEKIIDPEMTYSLRITGKKSQLEALRKFMDTNNMVYEKIS